MPSIPSVGPFGQLLIYPSPTLVGFPSSRQALRRKPTREQGLSLETLGHAIEYLYDSQVYQNRGSLSPSDVEAVRILMRLSREVFVECREVVPVSRSIRRGIRHWMLRLCSEHHAA